MRTILLFGLLTLLQCGHVFGQSPAPVSTPPPADETDVVKITTALIQVDVTVTDKKGNIVTDLRSDEIEIYENGQKQQITNFSFIANARTVQEAPKNTGEKNPVILPPSAVRAEQVKRTIAPCRRRSHAVF